MKRLLAVASVALFASCQPSPAPRADAPGTDAPAIGSVSNFAVSGSRIKAMGVVGADGSRAFINWFDSVLETSCAWSQFEDGVMRCYPTFGGIIRMYTNQSCTAEVLVGMKFYVTDQYGTDEVDGTRSFYRYGSKYAAPLYSNTFGCNKTGLEELYNIEVLDAAIFQSGNLEVLATDS